MPTTQEEIELPELFCITNRLDQIATTLRPWEHVPSRDSFPAEALVSKLTFDEYVKRADTKHIFYYAVEPMNPSMRPSKGNAPVAVRGMIADYDVAGGKRITAEEVADIAKALPAHLLPTFAHQTFSGGVRLVWLFERAVACELDVVRSEFHKLVAKKLTLQKLLPGWDTSAFGAYQTTYDVGTTAWMRMGPVVSSGLLEQWLIEAGANIKPGSIRTGGVEIPMEVVAAKVHEMFPGRWTGEFEAGRRGVVFFDPTSVNPTSAIVTPTGMLCFGQAKCHYSWADIFGAKWVESFVQDKLGDVTKDIWTDGTLYFYADIRGVMLPHPREALVLHLRAAGLSNEKAAGLSEVEKAIQHINQAKRIDGVAPYVFDSRAIVELLGKRMLNTSRIRVMQPAEDPAEWGTEGQFPWLSTLFETCFETLPEDENSNTQLDHFLAWFQHFYRGALTGTPNRGHALFLVGPAAVAKSFISNVVIGAAVGGGFPASRFITGATEFNKGPSESGLWLLDDSTPSESDDAARKFAGRLKSLVVNGSFESRALYRDGVELGMGGRRIVVTLNDDPTSMRMLPQLDGAIEDKLLFFLIQKPEVEFSQDYAANEANVRKELPSFLRWLLDWIPPDAVLAPNGRLFCKSFIHPTLRLGSGAANGITDLLQVADVFFRANNDPLVTTGLEPLTGTSAELLGRFTTCEMTRPLVKSETVRSIGRKLSLLMSTHSDRVSKVATCTSQGGFVVWRIAPCPAAPSL